MSSLITHFATAGSQATQTVTIAAEATTFDWKVAADFAAILNAFSEKIGIDPKGAFGEILIEVPVENSVQIELTGSTPQDNFERIITLDFHIQKLRATNPQAASTTSAIYSCFQIYRLLAENGNFGNQFPGIKALAGLSYIAGEQYRSLFLPDEGDFVDGALLTATYLIADVPYRNA